MTVSLPIESDSVGRGAFAGGASGQIASGLSAPGLGGPGLDGPGLGAFDLGASDLSAPGLGVADAATSSRAARLDLAAESFPSRWQSILNAMNAGDAQSADLAAEKSAMADRPLSSGSGLLRVSLRLAAGAEKSSAVAGAISGAATAVEASGLPDGDSAWNSVAASGENSGGSVRTRTSEKKDSAAEHSAAGLALAGSAVIAAPAAVSPTVSPALQPDTSAAALVHPGAIASDSFGAGELAAVPPRSSRLSPRALTAPASAAPNPAVTAPDADSGSGSDEGDAARQMIAASGAASASQSGSPAQNAMGPNHLPAADPASVPGQPPCGPAGSDGDAASGIASSAQTPGSAQANASPAGLPSVTQAAQAIPQSSPDAPAAAAAHIANPPMSAFSRPGREKNAETAPSGAHSVAAGDASLLGRIPSPASSGTGAAGAAQPGQGVVTAQGAFAALDAGATPEELRWVHAGAHQAEAGFEDPALGWVGVRATVSAGAVHAAIVPGTEYASQILSGHLAGLNAHLAAEHVPISSLSMSAAGGDSSALSGGMQFGSGAAGGGGTGTAHAGGGQANVGRQGGEQTSQPGLSFTAGTDRGAAIAQLSASGLPQGVLQYAPGLHISVTA